MNGSKLSIPSSAFDTNPSSGDSGTIFDSGTTLAILVDEAYDAFMNEVRICFSHDIRSTTLNL